MTRTKVLITGSTDGIGLEAARLLLAEGHHVLVHGRNPEKLARVQSDLAALAGGGVVEGFLADLSDLAEVERLATTVRAKHTTLDVLINNAGVYRTPSPRSKDGFDVRFAVNTFAPYVLTEALLPLLGATGRVVNLSSAAQSPVDLEALAGEPRLADGAAYAQSKLALTMWSRDLALRLGDDGPVVVAVNPGSLLATNMVRDAFGVPGADIGIGADILRRAALSTEFADASGAYFDNDRGAFGSPHPDALDPQKTEALVRALASAMARTRTGRHK